MSTGGATTGAGGAGTGWPTSWPRRIKPSAGYIGGAGGGDPRSGLRGAAAAAASRMAPIQSTWRHRRWRRVTRLNRWYWRSRRHHQSIQNIRASRAQACKSMSNRREQLDALYRQDCFTVPKSQWPAFRQSLLEQAKSTPGGLHLQVGRDGQAFIGSQQQIADRGRGATQPQTIDLAGNDRGLCNGGSGPDAANRHRSTALRSIEIWTAR